MDYIKESRYQMYCKAREVGVRTCTLFVATPPAQCRERNAARDETSAYVPATLDNLISRFEEPNSAARWDAPLVTIAADDPSLDQRGEGADAGVHGSGRADLAGNYGGKAQAAESCGSHYPELLDLLPQPPRFDVDSRNYNPPLPAVPLTPFRPQPVHPPKLSHTNAHHFRAAQARDNAAAAAAQAAVYAARCSDGVWARVLQEGDRRVVCTAPAMQEHLQ